MTNDWKNDDWLIGRVVIGNCLKKSLNQDKQDERMYRIMD
jgi:hypothetical protein